jgi:hypothetical protein
MLERIGEHTSKEDAVKIYNNNMERIERELRILSGKIDEARKPARRA